MKFSSFLRKYDLRAQESVFVDWIVTSGFEYEKESVRVWNEQTATWGRSEVPTPTVIYDANADAISQAFEAWYEAYLIEEPKRQAQLAEEEAKASALRVEEQKKKQLDMSSMLITSGFSFEGYTITKYSGYISGDDVVQIDRGSQGFFSSVTDVGASLMESLVDIRRNALQELKEAAHALGCNAVIGVDFDYLTLDPETVNASGGTLYMPYVFGVTANGNAVIIEKIRKTVK